MLWAASPGAAARRPHLLLFCDFVLQDLSVLRKRQRRLKTAVRPRAQVRRRLPECASRAGHPGAARGRGSAVGTERWVAGAAREAEQGSEAKGGRSLGREAPCAL